MVGNERIIALNVESFTTLKAANDGFSLFSNKKHTRAMGIDVYKWMAISKMPSTQIEAVLYKCGEV